MTDYPILMPYAWHRSLHMREFNVIDRLHVSLMHRWSGLHIAWLTAGRGPAEP